MGQGVPELHIFMMMDELDERAVKPLPTGFSIRNCRPDEYDAWKSMHIDDPAQASLYHGVLDDYFKLVYAPHGGLFFERCRFVCDANGAPVGTAFIWRAYGEVNTLHWLKVLPSHEGLGIGRGLLSALFTELAPGDFPVYLHTHPTSFRAVKLYTDFGFRLLRDRRIGFRDNHLVESLPILERHMPASDYARLRSVDAPVDFLEAVRKTDYEQF